MPGRFAFLRYADTSASEVPGAVQSWDCRCSRRPRLAPPVRGVDSTVGQGRAERVITRASLGRSFACPAVSSGCALSHRLPDVSPHRHRRDLQASGNGPGAQACDMVQPQDLSYSTHGQSLVRHRDALPQISREFHGGCPASLSSEAQTSCTVPVRAAKVISIQPESPITLRRNRRSLSTGMTDHSPSEWVIALGRNPHLD